VPVGVNTQTNELELNTGGAQFYISFMPLPLLDGKHTVFGRIVQGIEALGMLKVVDLTDEKERKDPDLRPDTIVSARVLRKRDHPYRPTPVYGQLPK
jgi:cyclophilin family peptidyl-prolyl cis-trans isomerase